MHRLYRILTTETLRSTLKNGLEHYNRTIDGCSLGKVYNNDIVWNVFLLLIFHIY